ncbi:LacI family DNA-binding transcriptional regulator [Promicromonospora sp. MEB111]|uniref:LacI family DNA-binding transcriptional regulator n=1 Tax=Promicromonospora sp. MEB111 TaxID=3040301 RepID=UPI002550EC43|nr:LacI family DNA-binding transcriptional regulator [Promicromonospora sp. MEB111]
MSKDLRRAAPTLEDVAKVAGVSRATVSRVINGKRKVAPAVQEVVLEAVAETGYVPNRAARSLVTRRTGTVAVVISGADADPEGELDLSGVFSDPFFGRVVGSLVRTLRPHDVHPVLMFADDAQTRGQVTSYLRFGNADGALLVSTYADDPLPEELIGTGRPIVLFARPGHAIPASYVDLANADGARMAANHLLDRGCSTLGVISGPLDVPSARDRLDGFRDAAARRGHAFVPSVAGSFTFESGESAMAELLASAPDLDGVFVSNDLMAQGAIHVLQTQGRRVPDDVAIVGFDDSPVAVQTRPRLTTVRQPVEKMAEEMARMLLEQIDADEPAVRSAIFEPILVVRDSA